MTTAGRRRRTRARCRPPGRPPSPCRPASAAPQLPRPRPPAQVQDADSGELTTTEDDKVAMDRCGLVLMRIERALFVMLAAGSFKIEPSKYPSVGLAGRVDVGHAPPGSRGAGPR